MNWVNAFLILLIGITVFEGINRGFLRSALNLGAFFLSVITSYLLYPVLSTAVRASDSLFKFLLYYTEGAEKIASFENTTLLIDKLSPTQLDNIISTSNLSEPFSSLVRQNVESKAFAADGLSKIGDYFNMTIVCAVLNILSFLTVFILARVVYTFVLGAINYTVEFPELKQYDRTTGAFFGASRGILICFLFAAVVPVIFLIVPVDKVAEYFQDSSLGMFFYNNNFFLHLIHGTV